MMAGWAAATVTMLSCGRQPDRESTVPPSASQVLERHSDSLMNIPGVVGTAEGSCAGRPCILVLVERLTPTVRKAVPAELDGIQVDIRETGRIQAR